MGLIWGQTLFNQNFRKVTYTHTQERKKKEKKKVEKNKEIEQERNRAGKDKKNPFIYL